MWTIVLIVAAVSVVQVLLGIGVGLWLRRGETPETERGRLETRRAWQLLEWLCRLSGDMASDVDRHQSRLDEINSRIQDLKSDGTSPVTALVIDVVGDIVEANQRLKDRLVSAEVQLDQQRAAMASHLSEALTDPLTSLPNRRALDDDLARRFAFWERRAEPFTLMLIDVDGFKSINDTYGHPAGDQVLRQVAARLRGALRTMDLVTRYGGEEFAAVLPDTVGADAETAAAHVLAAVQDAEFAVDGHTLRLTVSAGLANTLPGETVADLFKRTDAALYASKRGGRNCAHHHDGTQAVRLYLAEREARSTSGNPAEPGPDRSSPSANLETACDELREHIAQARGGRAG